MLVEEMHVLKAADRCRYVRGSGVLQNITDIANDSLDLTQRLQSKANKWLE